MSKTRSKNKSPKRDPSRKKGPTQEQESNSATPKAAADPATAATGKPRFRRRTKIILTLLLCALAWPAYRSVEVYRLRKMAWDAAEARQAGDWKRLEAICSRWGKSDPQTAIPWILAAEAAERQSTMKRAAAYLEQLPPDAPQTPDMLLQLATIYFGPLNEPLKGEATYHRALEIDPLFKEGHRRLIFHYGITLQRIKMAQQARLAIQLGCDLPETYVYLMGTNWLTFSNAYEFNGKWLQSGTNDELFQVAQLVHWAGAAGLTDTSEEVEEVDTTRAKNAQHMQLLRECFEKYPTNPELLAYFLKRETIQGNAEAVAKLLAEVPAEAADDNRFWHFKGWLHATRDELEDAEACYRKALELNPYAWESQFELAGVLRKSQRFDEVETLTALYIEGKALRKTILQLPDVQSVPPQVLVQMHHYAVGCGDTEVAQHLAERMKQLGFGGN